MASTTAQTSVDAKSTSGPGVTIDFSAAKSNVTAVLAVTGTVTLGLVQVEASQDGTNWVTVHAFDGSTGVNRYRSFSGGAFRYWRGNVARTVAGGGTVTLTFMEADA